MKNKTNILGAKYDISKVTHEELKKELSSNNETYVFGCCDYETRKIYINKNLKGQSYDETLRHEIVHAFFKESGLDYECTFARDELLVDWIALMLPRMAEVCNDLGILKIYYDDSGDNKSTSTATMQNEMRNANKHRTKVLR